MPFSNCEIIPKLLHGNLKLDENLHIGFLRSTISVSSNGEDIYSRRETRVSRERDTYVCFREETADRHLITIIAVVSLENTTVGFLSRAVASYAFDEATRKSVAVAFSPRVGKKEEREIHWRYGLVSVRVERTSMWQKKGRKRKKERFLLDSFLRPLLGTPNSEAGNGLDFLRLRIFYHRNGLSYLNF